MKFTAIGVHVLPGARHEQFRIRIEQAGAGWRDVSSLGHCCADDAMRVLAEFGLPAERAGQLIRAAREWASAELRRDRLPSEWNPEALGLLCNSP